MTPTISTTALGRRYRGQAALEDVSLEVEPDTVTGLLGRNGAGKTTLMRIVTGLEFPTSGSIAVFGETPAENEAVLRRMVFVREDQAYPDLRVSHVIRVASWFYPNWNGELARQLVTDLTSRCSGGSGSCRAGCARRSGSSSGWPPAPS